MPKNFFFRREVVACPNDIQHNVRIHFSVGSIVALVFFLSFPASIHSSEPDTSSIEVALKKNLSALRRPIRSGIAVRNLSTGESLVSISGDMHFIPASVTKLFTANAALSTWGEGFEFVTTVDCTRRSLRHDSVIGNIYLSGNSDPELSSATIDSLAEIFVGRGYRFVSGEIIVSSMGKNIPRATQPNDSLLIVTPDSLLEDSTAEESAKKKNEEEEFEEDTNIHGYVSGGTELALNRNMIFVLVTAGNKKGERVSATASLPGVEVIVRAKTAPLAQLIKRRIRLRSSRRGKPRYRIKQYYRSTAKLFVHNEVEHGIERITIDGTLPAHSRKQFTLPLRSPSIAAGMALREALAKRGVTIGTSVRIGDEPMFADPIAEHHHSLHDLLATMNKESDNYLAESLFRRFDAGTQRGMETVRRSAIEKHIQPECFFAGDGCGLARNNFVTPNGLLDLLAGMYNDKKIFPVLFSSLSIAGVDGTLHKRLSGMTARGHVFAKSGTLQGVRSLAGYIITAKGDTLAFAFMHEGVRSSVPIRKAQDAMCQLLYEH